MSVSSSPDVLDAFQRFGRDEDRLRPVDILVRHREIFGYHSLDTLDCLIAATIQAGPEQGHLNKPLIDDGQDTVAQLRNIAAMREFCRDELGFVLDTSCLTKAQFVQAAVPRLMGAMELTRWAREADSRALRIRLNSLQLTQQVAPNGTVLPAIFPSGFRLRALVAWKNVLNKDVSETHTTGAELFQTGGGGGTGGECGNESGSGGLSSGSGSGQMLRSDSTICGGGSGGAQVEINSVFRTTCTTSCTIRVAVDTASGHEFAHGFIRASFLPGEAAPRYSFSVPLLRPANLTKIINAPLSAKKMTKAQQIAAKKNHQRSHSASMSAGASASAAENSSGPSSSASGAGGAALPGHQSQSAPTLQRQQAAAQAALASGASSHQSMSAMKGRNGGAAAGGGAGGDEAGIIVGSLSVDIDSIASSFGNLVALAHTMRHQEKVHGQNRENEEADQNADDDDDDDVKNNVADTKKLPSSAIAATDTIASTFRPPEALDQGETSTVAFFLKRLEEGSAERRRQRQLQRLQEEQEDVVANNVEGAQEHDDDDDDDDG